MPSSSLALVGSDPAPPLPADAVDRVRKAIADAGLTQAAAAVEIGVSDATLSQWLAGKYPGDVAAIAARAERWLEARAEREAVARQLPDAPPWVETTAAERILGALSYAQIARDVALIYGSPGTGKTVACEHYAQTRPNVWHATMTSAARTIGPCLERAAQAMGIRHIPSRSWRVEAAIVERSRGTAGLLVIDEAQHLDIRSLEALRGIHDAAGIGLAMLGSEMVYARLTGGARSAYSAQIFSRIGIRVRLGQPSTEDVDSLCDAWRLRDLKARKRLQAIATSPGALRSVTKAVRMATLLADGDTVRERHIQAALRDFDA